MNEKQVRRFDRLYPWFGGLSADLLFWIAVDTMFLQVVKGLDVSTIVLSTTIAHLLGITLQLPATRIVKRIGNTAAVRIGSVLALLAALCLTLARGFWMVVAGRALAELSLSFKSMVNVSLKNNLDALGRGEEYIDRSTKALSIYSVVTMIIALVWGPMFNLNPYLPMLGCILSCVICIVLSFFMVDVPPKTDPAASKQSQKRMPKTTLFHFTRPILWTILCFAIFFAIVTTGQENSKLFIQDEMLTDVGQETTALLLSVILFISRVIRVFSNMIFYPLFQKLKDKVGILFPLLLTLSFLCTTAGAMLPNVSAKYIVMGLGYVLILFSRDPYKLYANNLVVHRAAPEDQPVVFMNMELLRKICVTGTSLIFTAVLMALPIASLMWVYLGLCAVAVAFSIHLYRIITHARTSL